jgi:hypothetical protein
LPATPHPVGDQDSFVLCHGAADLQQQLVVGVIAHGVFQKADLTPHFGQFVDEQHLMHIVAGQPVGRGDQHQFKLRQCRMIPQVIQARAVEFGPTVAVVPVDVLFREAPVGVLGDVGQQAFDLLLNRLRLMLVVG